MDVIGKLDIILQKINTDKEYFKPSIPETMKDIDIELNKFVKEYMLLSQDEREIIKLYISTDYAWVLLIFAENMATYALRLSEQELFSNGLTALSMVYGVLDAREIMVIMALYCDVHKKRGLIFDRIVNDAGDFSKFVEDFLKRDESDKSLESMGYVLTKNENNSPIYKRTW